MRWSYEDLMALPVPVYEVLVDEAAAIARARAVGGGGIDVDDLE